MDLLEKLSMKRNEIQQYIKPILSDKSYLWCRSVLNDMVRNSMVNYQYDIVCKQILVLSNFKKFFEEYVTEVTPGGIITTLYLIAVQLRLRNLGDVIESYDEFIEDVDISELNPLDRDAVDIFDLSIHMSILENKIYKSNNEVFAGGLNTLLLL